MMKGTKTCRTSGDDECNRLNIVRIMMMTQTDDEVNHIKLR